MLPSETAVITLGVATADSADPRITLLLACCAAGALVGDNLCYLVGRRFGAAHRGPVLPGAGRARSGAPGPSARCSDADAAPARSGRDCRGKHHPAIIPRSTRDTAGTER